MIHIKEDGQQSCILMLKEAGSSNELEVDPRLIGLSCFKNGQQQIQEVNAYPRIF